MLTQKIFDQSTSYHVSNVLKVFLTQQDEEKLHFISNRYNHCNPLFTGLPKQSIDKLQLIVDSAAKGLTRTRSREHITPVLVYLRWLPVSFRIDFKVLLIVYKALIGLRPAYMTKCLYFYNPSQPLRASAVVI